MLRKFYVFITVLIVGLCFSFQPSSSNEIDINQLDSNKLEQLILKKVNELRKKKNAPVLVINPILQKAAQDQSNFLVKKKKLTHSQPTKGKKRPIDRTDFYGGKFTYVGENVAYTYINRSVDAINNSTGVTLSTYSQLAEYLFLLWKKSPPHFKTMKDKGFDKTSIRFAIDMKTQRIYATQVFAK